jgi:Zn-dependent peptidase ImmA (M78 family)
VRQELAAETLDAFSEWDSDYRRPFIVLGADKESCARSRFDAAHELAHMLLHRNISDSVLRDQTKFKLIEQQANYFAGAFLLPATSFASEFHAPSLDFFHSLKARWKVSIAAMIKRAANLELMKPEQEQRLWTNLTRRGWKKEEPLDDVLEPEQPRFVARALDLLISNRMLTVMELSTNLGLRVRDIEDVCGFQPNELAQADAPPLRINPSALASGVKKSEATGNWIMPIRKSL